jgi:hypothetical protein
MKLSERDRLEKRVLEILEGHQIPCACEVCTAFMSVAEPMQGFSAAIAVVKAQSAPRAGWVH